MSSRLWLRTRQIFFSGHATQLWVYLDITRRNRTQMQKELKWTLKWLFFIQLGNFCLSSHANRTVSRCVDDADVMWQTWLCTRSCRCHSGYINRSVRWECVWQAKLCSFTFGYLIKRHCFTLRSVHFISFDLTLSLSEPSSSLFFTHCTHQILKKKLQLFRVYYTRVFLYFCIFIISKRHSSNTQCTLYCLRP